jgi:hypothetical protein
MGDVFTSELSACGSCGLNVAGVQSDDYARIVATHDSPGQQGRPIVELTPDTHDGVAYQTFRCPSCGNRNGFTVASKGAGLN